MPLLRNQQNTRHIRWNQVSMGMGKTIRLLQLLQTPRPILSSQKNPATLDRPEYDTEAAGDVQRPTANNISTGEMNDPNITTNADRR